MALPFVLALCLTPGAQSQGAEALFSGSTPVLGASDQFQAVLDLDHDGDLDVLAWWWIAPVGNVPRVMIKGMLVDGEGTLAPRWSFASPDGGQANCLYAATTIGDFDGDGWDDFAIGVGQRVFVYATRTDGSPQFMANFRVPTYTVSTESLVAGDMDGDGLDDIVVIDRWRVAVMLSSGMGNDFSYAGSVSASFAGGTKSLATMLDFDQNGTQDIAFRRDYPSEIYLLSVENGALVNHPFLDTAMPYAAGFTAGDVDGDGDIDLVTFDRQGFDPPTYEVFRCQGPGVYIRDAIAVGGPATQLIDIDMDGDLDGLCCGGGSGCDLDNDGQTQFEICLNDGNGVFDVSVGIPSLETGYDGLAGVVDIDGDGDMDMVAGRSMLLNHLALGAPYCEPPANSTGNVSRLYMTGSTSLTRSDLAIHASGLPEDKTCIVLLGGQAGSIPVGNSLLCLGNPVQRYAVTTSNSQGRLHMDIPTDSLPNSYPGDVSAGDTRRFQVWHRDNGVNAFGFSEGIRLTFAP